MDLEDAFGRIALGGADSAAAAATAISPKTRMGELAFLKSTLHEDAWFLPDDWEESVLGQILGGLRADHSQVCLQALDCLLALVPQLNECELTPFAKELATTVGEVLGDSRPSVRERAQEVLALFLTKVGGGVGAVLEGLRPATTNRNPRMRQEVAKFLGGRMVTEVPGVAGEERQLLLEALAALAADANSEVRNLAMDGLERVVLAAAAADRERVVQDLETMGLLRGPELKQLQQAVATGVGGVADELGNSSSDDEFAAFDAMASLAPSRPPPPAAPPVAAVMPAAPSTYVPPAPSSAATRKPVAGRHNEKESKISEHVEASTEVIPVTVRSERELAEEMAAVGAGLAASEDQWQSRVEALQRLQGLAVGGAGEFEAFVPAIKGMQQHVTSQISSLRSSLCREGCTTVAVLAQALGDAFLPLAEVWAPALLRTTQTNILIMAMSADQCLRCVVCCTRVGFPRLLPVLVEGVGTKNDTERLRCITAVMLALWQWEEASLEKSVEAVCKMLKAAVADKKEAVRAAARQCFWALHRKFPSAAETVLDTLDASRQKILRKEKGAVNQEVVDGLVPTRRYHAVSEYSQKKQPANNNTSQVPAAALVEAAADAPSSAPAAPSALSRGPRRSSISGGGALRVAAPAPKAVAETKEPTTKGGGGGGGGRAPPVAPPTRPPGNKLPKAPTSSSSSNSSHAAAPSLPMDDPHVASLAPPARRLSISGPLRVMRSTPGTPSAARTESSSNHQHEPPAAVPLAPVPMSTSSGNADRSWGSILRDAESPAWNERVGCFEDAAAKVREMVETGASVGPEEAAAVGRVLGMVLRHLTDANNRVAQTAMEAVAELLQVPSPEFVTKAIVPALDHLLPRVLAKVADPKEHLRTTAATALARCRSVVDPPSLCASLARTFHEQPERAKAAALEVMKTSIPEAHAFFSHGSALRNFLHKLAGLLASQVSLSLALERAASACVVALHQVLPSLFMESLAHLPLEPQMAVRRVLQQAQVQVPEVVLPAVTNVRLATAPSTHPLPPSSAPPLPPKSRLPLAAVGSGDEENTMPLRAAANASSAAPKTDGGLMKKKTRSCTAGLNTTSPDETAMWALGVLGDELASPQSRSQALDDLMGVLGQEEDPALWDRYFAPSLHLFVDGLKKVPPLSPSAGCCPLLQPFGGPQQADEDVWASGVKRPQSNKAFPFGVYLSLRGLRQLLRFSRHDAPKAAAFEPYLDSLLSHLLACAVTESIDLFQHAEKVLGCLVIAAADPDRLFHAFSSLLTHPSTTVPRLLLGIRALPKLLQRVQAATVAAALPVLCPVLVRHINDSEIVVRMTVVSAVAELYMVVRDDLLPHLHAKLRPAQLKLVTIYIEKATQRQAAAVAAAAGRGGGGGGGGGVRRTPFAEVQIQ